MLSATVVLFASANVFADGHFQEMAHLQIARSGPVVCDRDGVLAIGGSSIEGALASVERWRPRENVWRRQAAMHAPRAGHGATVLADGRVLVTGGGARRAEVYDGSSWAFSGRMLELRAGHTATLLADGRVLVVGGRDDRRELATAEVWDPATQTWRATARLHDARAAHTATLLTDGRVLVAGGRRGDAALRSAELFDPRANRWTPAEPMPDDEERADHTATLLLDGRVLVVGGAGDGGALDARSHALLFDPPTGRWSRTANGASGGRTRHTATRLRDGRVLVVGGYQEECHDKGCTIEKTHVAELYDPSRDQWSKAGDAIEGRADHGAALLEDGTVLVAGGAPYSHASELTHSSELWR